MTQKITSEYYNSGVIFTLAFVNAVHSFLKGLFIYFFGKPDALFFSYLALVFVGFVVYTVKSIYRRTFTGIGILKYLGRKLLSLTLVCLAVILQRIISVEMAFRELTLMFLIINQSLELLKHAENIVPVPKKISDALKKLQEDSENNSETTHEEDE